MFQRRDCAPVYVVVVIGVTTAILVLILMRN